MCHPEPKAKDLHVLSRSLVFALVLPYTLHAQTLTRDDSTLVSRILLAEDRRDSTDSALAEGSRHADARKRRRMWIGSKPYHSPRFSTAAD